ncbi:MAG: hypothetical protein JWP42_190, partial [Pseudomonas sp.]|nr:hypothetical protein [Pseudomonas sp.]
RFTDMFKDWFIAKTASPPSERLLQAVMWKKHTYEGARAIENLAGKSGLSPHQYVLNSVVNDTLERHSILKQRFGENVNTDSLQALQNYQELMSEAYDIARLLRDFNDKRILAPEMYTKVNQANSKTFDIMTTLDKNTPTEIATLRQRHLELRPPPPYTEFPDSFSHVNPSAPLETSAAGLRGALPTRHK